MIDGLTGNHNAGHVGPAYAMHADYEQVVATQPAGGGAGRVVAVLPRSGWASLAA